MHQIEVRCCAVDPLLLQPLRSAFRPPCSAVDLDLIDTLKIDIAFIREVTTNPQDAAITRTIIELAHSLSLQVVAEGVETQDQLAFLKAAGCDQIQGYLFSRPLPAITLERLLLERLPRL